MLIVLLKVHAKELPEGLKHQIEESTSIYITEDVMEQAGNKKRISTEILKGTGFPGHISVALPARANVGHRLIELKRISYKKDGIVFASGCAYTIENGSFQYFGKDISLQDVREFIASVSGPNNKH